MFLPRSPPGGLFFFCKEQTAHANSSFFCPDNLVLAADALRAGIVPGSPTVHVGKLLPRLVGKYGFKDAFNPSYTFGPGNENGWFDSDYIGIDQGPILLQIENHRTGFLWELMKKNPYIRQGLQKAGFTGGWL